MSDRFFKDWNRREFLQGMGSGAAGMALSGCGINADRSAKGLTEEALAVKQIVNSKTLEKPNLTIGYVPVNDCAPFAIAWKKGFFRKYGLNVKLNREASWATSRDGVIFARLDASPVVSGAVTNARIGAEGARHAPLCAAMTIHRHGNAMTMNKAMWDFGLRPWHEYNGNFEEFGRSINLRGQESWANTITVGLMKKTGHLHRRIQLFSLIYPPISLKYQTIIQHFFGNLTVFG